MITKIKLSDGTVENIGAALANITGADDLKAIEALSATGVLRRTGNNTWSLDTNLVKVITNRTKPSNMNVNDLWYEIL